MQITLSGAARRMILALVLGATLVPLAPNTGTVIAKQSVSALERIATAHDIAGDLR